MLMEAEDTASAERSQGSTQAMATDGCNNNDANDLDGLDSGPEPTAPTVATGAASQDVTPAPAEQQPAALAAVEASEPCQAVTKTRKAAAERWHGIKALVARRQNHPDRKWSRTSAQLHAGLGTLVFKSSSDLSATGVEGAHDSLLRSSMSAQTTSRTATEVQDDSIHAAAQLGDAGKLTNLSRLDLEQRNADGMQPLHVAAQHGHVQAVELLLQQKASVDAVDHSRGTPLSLACRFGHAECISALLQAGAQKEGLGETYQVCALHYAAVHGDVDCINLLIEANAKVEHADTDGWTALHYAARFNNLAAVERLLEAKADIHACDVMGWTPLHNAARNGLAKGVECLLRHGAELRTENNHGQTPLHVACREGKVKVVGIMVQHGSNNGYLHELLDKRDANGETAEMCSSSRTAIAALKGQYCHAYEGSQMTSVINSLHWTDPSGTSTSCTIL